ncbi:hypothetical protein ILUMI_10941 [Ignelater luminosus]|uniref:DDE-1 domain-containing protein n=1 Tax=Ignelater luminosus TaxID=2038154 RepID=A0A8K0D155_IGNLU|nr:hypothetical protein ILUMI_10941 [Ignelater luminosus]
MWLLLMVGSPIKWLERTGFVMIRHTLLLRTSEQTSFNRAISFNNHNVNLFFKNLKEVKEKFRFSPQDVYNLDETAFTTVHKPPKVLAKGGQKIVGQITSAERGTLVTIVAIVSASGKAIPPFLIFPRVHFKEHMLHNAPIGSKGAASPSGWMVSYLFSSELKHFIELERLTNPKLIIMDNHESHLSIETLNFAKENGFNTPYITNTLQSQVAATRCGCC